MKQCLLLSLKEIYVQLSLISNVTRQLMFLVQFSGGAQCSDRLLTNTSTSFYYFRAELHISWVFCWKNVPCATGLYDCILLYIPAALMNSSVSCRSERSMLHGHTFKKTRADSLTECVMACNNGAMCQSVNYIINEDVCELNNRTKEARPDDLVPHENCMWHDLVKEVLVEARG